MRKVSQKHGGFLPGVDALEDRNLLSLGAGPSVNMEVPPPMAREAVAIVVRPYYEIDQSSNVLSSSVSSSLVYANHDPIRVPVRGWGSENVSDFSSLKPATDTYQQPSNDFGTVTVGRIQPSIPLPVSLLLRGWGSENSSPVSFLKPATDTYQLGAVDFNGVPTDHMPPTIMDLAGRMTTIAPITMMAPEYFTAHPGSFAFAGGRPPSEWSDDMANMPLHGPSSSEHVLLANSPNTVIPFVGAPATVNHSDPVNATSPSDAPSVFQAINRGVNGLLISARIGLIQANQISLSSPTAVTEAPATLVVGNDSVEPVAVPTSTAPEEIPSPVGADLITELVPFNLESIKDSFSWVLGQFESLESPASDHASSHLRLFLPVAITIGAIEGFRRWRNRQSHLGPIRVRKTRSSVLRGFF